MVDLKLMVEKIKKIANQRGYDIETHRLENALTYDELRLRHYKQVFSTEEGNWVLKDLMKEGGLLSSFEADDPLKLARLEGKRSMAVRISSSLGLNFDQVRKMYSDIEEDKRW